MKAFEVVIVGGGPVGVGLGIELGQRGIRVALVEKHPEPQPIPKGQNLTQRTCEHFHFWGVEDEIRRAREMPASFPIGGLTVYSNLMSPYWFEWLKRELVRPYYFTDNERLPQYATEGVLRARLAELDSVQVYYGYQVESVAQHDEGVDVLAQARQGDEQLQLRGQFVVGCDGSRSVVRENAGISQTKSDHDKRMVLLVFRSRELHQHLERFPGKSFYKVLHPELEGYWRFFGRVDVGEKFFFHCPVPAETTRDNFDFSALLQEAAGVEFPHEFDYVGFWDLRVAVADQYRANQIFIAGDACHSHPPYGGYGINMGFEDARNLGWKLAATLQGWGSNALLDSYDAERRPVFASLGSDFIEAVIEKDKQFVATYNPDWDIAGI